MYKFEFKAGYRNKEYIISRIICEVQLLWVVCLGVGLFNFVGYRVQDNGSYRSFEWPIGMFLFVLKNKLFFHAISNLSHGIYAYGLFGQVMCSVQTGYISIVESISF